MESPGNREKQKEGSTKQVFRKWILLTGVLATLLVILSIGYVRLRIEQIQDGYSLARLKVEHEQLLALQRKLRLEWSRLNDPFHLEELGRNQFGLAPPRQDQRLLRR